MAKKKIKNKLSITELLEQMKQNQVNDLGIIQELTSEIQARLKEVEGKIQEANVAKEKAESEIKEAKAAKEEAKEAKKDAEYKEELAKLAVQEAKTVKEEYDKDENLKRAQFDNKGLKIQLDNTLKVIDQLSAENESLKKFVAEAFNLYGAIKAPIASPLAVMKSRNERALLEDRLNNSKKLQDLNVDLQAKNADLLKKLSKAEDSKKRWSDFVERVEKEEEQFNAEFPEYTGRID